MSYYYIHPLFLLFDTSHAVHKKNKNRRCIPAQYPCLADFRLCSVILSIFFPSGISGYNKNSGPFSGVFPLSYDVFILYTAYLLYAVFTFF